MELRRRKGTRHLRLSINMKNRIVVSVPWHCPEQVCRLFLEQHRPWLEQRLQAAPEVMGIRKWLEKCPQLSIDGHWMRVHFQVSRRITAHFDILPEVGEVWLCLPQSSSDPTLFALVRSIAREALSRRVKTQAARFGLDYRKLTVRDQSSRWGSCSSKRGISLNWRLILVEPELQDYVILHELAHLSEMNHSSRFWALLDHYDPLRREHEKRLDALTPRIMRVRVS